MDSAKPAKLLRVYLNENDQFKHQPLYVALVHLLRSKGIATATATRTLSGSDSLAQRSFRRVWPLATLSLVVECLDEATRVNEVLPAVLQMVQDRPCIVLDGQMWSERRSKY